MGGPHRRHEVVVQPALAVPVPAAVGPAGDGLQVVPAQAQGAAQLALHRGVPRPVAFLRVPAGRARHALRRRQPRAPVGRPGWLVWHYVRACAGRPRCHLRAPKEEGQDQRVRQHLRAVLDVRLQARHQPQRVRRPPPPLASLEDRRREVDPRRRGQHDAPGRVRAAADPRGMREPPETDRLVHVDPFPAMVNAAFDDLPQHSRVRTFPRLQASSILCRRPARVHARRRLLVGDSHLRHLRRRLLPLGRGRRVRLRRRKVPEPHEDDAVLLHVRRVLPACGRPVDTQGQQAVEGLLPEPGGEGDACRDKGPSGAGHSPERCAL
mmetsp:Transcript_31597/g.89020  ORF Transcript_31597/g.89020 Transcript_31597/m.89020 type:complete len:323 (+) Transcript_31597:654-1622(+)